MDGTDYPQFLTVRELIAPFLRFSVSRFVFIFSLEFALKYPGNKVLS